MEFGVSGGPKTLGEGVRGMGSSRELIYGVYGWKFRV